MKAVLLACAVMTSVAPTLAQPAPVFSIDYRNPGLAPAHWIITFSPDGAGHFHSERGDAPKDALLAFEATNIDRDIQVGTQFADRAFATARQHSFFAVPCESHMKVAFQGWKALTYTGTDGTGSCTFNYSKDKEIQGLADSMVGVAASVIEGARLETLLQHDRLGLDKETEYLVDAASDGRVQQLCTIHTILERLADDPQVMDRVRKRARMLLARAQR